MLRPKHSNDQGLTLIELLLVVVILGIVVALALPILNNTLGIGAQKSDQATAENIAQFQHDWTQNGYAVIVGTGSEMGYLLAQDADGKVVSRIKIGSTGAGAVQYQTRYLATEYPTGGWVSAHGSNSGAAILVNAHNITDVTFDENSHVLSFSVTGMSGVLPSGYDLGDLQLRVRAGANTDGTNLSGDILTATNNTVGFNQGSANSNFNARLSPDGDKLTVTAYLDSTTAAWMDSGMNMRSQTIMPNVSNDILDISFSLWQNPAEALTPIFAIQ